MALQPGNRLGPYEILAPLSKGGMGEVYRARDTKLGREVALKVLPEKFASDPSRLERFRREAQVLASLNHPNIASIYGLEESGSVRALVMELVEGPTLAGRIKTGPIELDEALPIARQIAEGLEYAHERGVIHRDLKPANIKVTADGTVKVLDFGLAKALEGETVSSHVSDSPTLSAAATQAGVILGTAAYMSPEQAKGKPADRRADIWAFGCVLYEMLTGKQAFEGETVSDTLAGVLRAEPGWDALAGGTPPMVRKLLTRTLAKDPKRRLQAIGEARIVMEEALSGNVEAGLSRQLEDGGPATAGPPVQPWHRAMIWSLGAVAALSIGVALWTLLRGTRPSTRPVARLVVTLPPTDRLALGRTPVVALSADGSRLVYVANRATTTQLYLRLIDRFEATAIPGTEGAESPFFSPDGQSVGFFAEGKMKKVSLSGGAPLTLCSAASNRGASWAPDGAIIFTPTATSGLFEVSPAGGTPKPLTVPDRKKGEASHRWPEILPGGKAVLFTNWTGGSFDDAQIGVLSLETGEHRTLVERGTSARYVPSGHVVYARAGGLLAAPFDLRRLEVTGPPVSVLEGVSMNPGSGSADFSFSAVGSLAYVPGGSSVSERTLLWVDRKGVARPLPAPPGVYASPRLSPDGRQLAVGSDISGLWLYDLARGTLTRLTETSGAFPVPTWTPDGKHVTFRSMVSGSLNRHGMPADGSGAPERLTTSEHQQSPGSWSSDGQVLAFSDNDPTTGWDIWVLKLEGDPSTPLPSTSLRDPERSRGVGASRKVQPFLQTRFNEGAPAFSPDSRWLAYQSDESGRFEIYVRPFPGPGARSQISTEGGSEPVWGRNGRELFYRNGDKMMAAAVEVKPTFAAAKPKLLFEGHYERDVLAFYFEPDYDVSADGQRFLMIKASEQEQAAMQINVVLNWSEELKRRVPAEKK